MFGNNYHVFRLLGFVTLQSKNTVYESHYCKEFTQELPLYRI